MAIIQHYPKNQPLTPRDSTNFWLVIVVVSVAALVFGAYASYYNTSRNPYVTVAPENAETVILQSDD